MPGISRSFRQLARNLGRVGTGETLFGSPKTIQPTLDADAYAPHPSFSLNSPQLAAPPLSVWSMFLAPALGSTLGPIFVQNLQVTQTFHIWTYPNDTFGYPVPLIPSPLGQFTASTSRASIQSHVPIPARPVTAMELAILQFGIVELPPITDSTRLVIEQVNIAAFFSLNVWWEERQVNA